MANLRRLAFDLLDHASLAEQLGKEQGDEPDNGLNNVARRMREIAVLLHGYYPEKRGLTEYAFDGVSWHEEDDDGETQEQVRPIKKRSCCDGVMDFFFAREKIN